MTKQSTRETVVTWATLTIPRGAHQCWHQQTKLANRLVFPKNQTRSTTAAILVHRNQARAHWAGTESGGRDFLTLPPGSTPETKDSLSLPCNTLTTILTPSLQIFLGWPDACEETSGDAVASRYFCSSNAFPDAKPTDAKNRLSSSTKQIS